MTISINPYQPSNWVAAGSLLRNQPVKQVGRIFFYCNALSAAAERYSLSLEKTYKVAKAFFLVLAHSAVLPMTLVLGLIGKGITLFSSPKINRASLHRKPTLVQQPQTGDTPVYNNFSYLQQEFVRLNLHERAEYAYMKPEFDRTPIERCFGIMLEQIRVGLVTEVEHQAGHREFVLKMRVYLSAIMLKIQENQGIIECAEASEQDKERARASNEQALIALADASNVCAPTWLETVEKLFNTLYAPAEAENKLLFYLQAYKEELITQYVQIDMGFEHWHGLNFMRGALGRELGLNENTNALDPYGGGVVRTYKDALVKAFFKQLFMERYDNVNEIIASMHTQIERHPFDRCYYDQLVAIAEEMEILEAETFVQEHLVNANYKPNLKGVGLLLRHMEILR